MTEFDDEEEIKIKAESTFIDPAVKTKKELVDYILVSLGYPLLTVELEEQQLNLCIQFALETYTKYAYMGPDKYLFEDLNRYEHGKGLNLKKYNIIAIKEISTIRDNALNMGMGGDLFFSPYTFLQSNNIYPMNTRVGNAPSVGSWVTWQSVIEFMDLTHKMCGSMPDFQYDKSSKYLTLMPEPRKFKNNVPQPILLTCQVLPPLSELYGNEYVKRIALAKAKILLGTIRKKFAGTQLIGGSQIDTTIGDEGKEELDRIMENIRLDEAKCQSFYVV